MSGLVHRQADVADPRASFRALGTHRQQRLHPAFVAGPPRLDAAAQPHFFRRHLLVDLGVRQLLVGQPLFLLAREGGVVAGPLLLSARACCGRGRPLRSLIVPWNSRAPLTISQTYTPVGAR